MKFPDEDRRLLRPRGGKGRGAVGNVPGRFDKTRIVPSGEALEAARADQEDPPRDPRTTVTPEPIRTILTRNDSPDIPFDVSINPYKGCEHGCVYCFARPSHAFLDLSPGLDFETRIFSKPTAPDLLREALRKPGYVCRPIALGTNTDPYQPAERDLRITRGILEVLAEHRHPVTIVTKSSLVIRDLDLLGPMARQGRAAVYLSVTTLDPELARRMEPRAATPERRLRALQVISRQGIPTGVLSSPMIPALNDSELEAILERAASAGARTAGYILLRLPHELKQIFREWLEVHYPGKARKVLGILSQMRGGALYDSKYGDRMRGTGHFAELLRQRFEVTCRRLDLNLKRVELDSAAFRVPPRAGDQRSLFA